LGAEIWVCVCVCVDSINSFVQEKLFMIGDYLRNIIIKLLQKFSVCALLTEELMIFLYSAPLEMFLHVWSYICT
jgi:hypothetical protein